jgi:6-phosphogluconolactonase (cycloisomerase 2 family)
MPQRVVLSPRFRRALRPCAFCFQHPRLACLLLICIIFLLSVVSAAGQTAQQNVYGSTASQLAGFSVAASGALTALAGGPFSDPQFQGGLMAIDGHGQFLFLIERVNSGVWMFQIQSDGSLKRVSGSPFFAPAPGNVGPAPASPVSLATEHSGQFVYVGYASGDAAGHGAIIEFQINVTDPANPQLVPVTAQESSYVPASPLTMLTDPKGAYLYVGLAGAQAAGTNVYAIDGVTGAFNFVGTAGGGNPNTRAIALDPRGQFFFDGWGSSAGFIQSAQLAPAGTTIPIAAPISLGPGNVPHAMLVDGTGKFLYVDVLSAGGSYVFSIEPTGNLGSSPLSPLTTFNFQTGTAVADPEGPYIYSLQAEGIHAFAVDAVSGAVSDVNGSPFPVVPGAVTGIGGLAISGASGQAVTGVLAQLFPPSQDFGFVPVGQTSDSKPFSLTNIGGVAFNLTGVTVAGANASDFKSVPNCSLPAFLPTGRGSNATCSIGIRFVPTASGSRQATLITKTDTAGTQSTILTGIGVATPSGVTITPASLSFASTSEGTTTPAQILTLTSTGSATLHISSVTSGGSNMGDFMVTGGCSGAYATNATCAISVTFSPLADGPRTASIVITDDAPGSPQTIQLTGIGSGAPVGRPATTIAPPAISFAATPQSTTSAPQSISITNSGTAALHISSIHLSGPNAGDFTASGCTAAAYAAGSTCIVALTFTPSATGPRTGMLTIADDATGSPQTVQIIGTGTATSTSAITLSAAAISFAATALGTTSPQQNITATSSGAAPAHIASVQLSGANAADFKLNNGCTASAYAVNTACTLGLTFTPGAAGPRVATLTITDDAPNSPQTVALSGNASPLLTVAPAAGGSFSQAVTAGQTAMYSLQLIAGFDGNVSLACSGAPLAATCSAPSTVNVPTGATVPILITVKTTARAELTRRRRLPTDTPVNPLPIQNPMVLLYLLAGSTLLATAARALRKSSGAGTHPQRLAWEDILATCALVALCTLAGCGGGSSAPQNAPIVQPAVTPQGTTTITIALTATTSAGTQLPAIAPIQLMLTVN